MHLYEYFRVGPPVLNKDYVKVTVEFIVFLEAPLTESLTRFCGVQVHSTRRQRKLLGRAGRGRPLFGPYGPRLSLAPLSPVKHYVLHYCSHSDVLFSTGIENSIV